MRDRDAEETERERERETEREREREREESLTSRRPKVCFFPSRVETVFLRGLRELVVRRWAEKREGGRAREREIAAETET